MGPYPFISPDREEAYQLIIPSDFPPLSIANSIRSPSPNLDPNFSIFSILVGLLSISKSSISVNNLTK